MQISDLQQLTWKQCIWLIVCLALISYGFFFFKAEEKSIWSKDIEGLRAEVVREMLTSGDWLVPHLNGEIFITKPPLYYWLASFFSLSFGEVTEYTLRLPSLISAFLGLIWTFLIGFCLFNLRVAWLAVLILASSPLYIVMARAITIDMTLSWLTTATLGCFLLGSTRRENASRYYLWAFAFLGLAVMTKGPIGIMVPMFPLLGYWLLYSQQILHSPIPPSTLLKGIGIFLLLTLPWAGMIYLKVPNVGEVFYQETLFRYELSSYKNAKPFYFYFMVLLGTFAPWSLFLPSGFMVMIEKYRKKILPPEIVFLLLWFWPSFFIFSVTSTKRDYYLLPLYPALALFTGWIWDTYRIGPISRWQEKLFSFSICSIALIILLSAVGIPIFVRIFFPSLLKPALIISLIGLVLGSLILVLHSKQRFYLMFSGIILAVGVALWVTLTLVLPRVDLYRTRKNFFQEAASKVGSHTLINYRYNGYDLPFYVKRTIPIVEEPSQLYKFLELPDPVYVIMEDTSLASLRLKKVKVVLTGTWINPLRPQRVRKLILISNQLK